MLRAIDTNPQYMKELLRYIVGYYNAPAEYTGGVADLDISWIMGAILLIVMVVEFFKTIRWIFGGNKK